MAGSLFTSAASLLLLTLSTTTTTHAAPAPQADSYTKTCSLEAGTLITGPGTAKLTLTLFNELGEEKEHVAPEFNQQIGFPYGPTGGLGPTFDVTLLTTEGSGNWNFTYGRLELPDPVIFYWDDPNSCLFKEETEEGYEVRECVFPCRG